MVSASPLVCWGRLGHVTSGEWGSGTGGPGCVAGRRVPVTGQGPGWRDPSPKELVTSSALVLGGEGREGSWGVRGCRVQGLGSLLCREENLGSRGRGGSPCGWDSRASLWSSLCPAEVGIVLCGLRLVTLPAWSLMHSSILQASNLSLPPLLKVRFFRKEGGSSLGLKLILLFLMCIYLF